MRQKTPKLLEDIRLCCVAIRTYTTGFDLQEWLDNQMARDAVERNIGIIGEVCIRLRNTDPETASRIEDLNRIIGLRHRLAHGYDTEIDNVKVWQAVTGSVPRLEETMTSLLADVD